jgi:hypothetical protein
MRKELLDVATKLDDRLQKAIEMTRASVQVRYVFVTALAIVILVAVILAILREWPRLAALGSLIPGGAIAWILRSLRGFQDERIRLQFLVGKYEPLIVTCEEVPCLARVAERMQESFETLGAAPAKPGGAPASLQSSET